METAEKGAKYRPIAREHATSISDRIGEAARAGGNSYQVAADLNDKEAIFIASLPEEDRVLYEQLYVEEMNALTNATQDKTRAIEQETLRTEIQNAQSSLAWIWVIPAVLLILFFLFK